MNYLIDTHCFLWSLFSPEKLSRRVSGVLKDGANTIHVSAVSFWEIAIKHTIGKLSLTGISPAQLPASARAANYELLSLNPDEAAAFQSHPGRSGHQVRHDVIVGVAIKLDSGSTHGEPSL